MPPKRFPCRTCDKSWTREADLKKHRRHFCPGRSNEADLLRQNMRNVQRNKFRDGSRGSLEPTVPQTSYIGEVSEMEVDANPGVNIFDAAETLVLPPPQVGPLLRRADSIVIAPTRSGRRRTFPRHLTDFISSSRSAIPHIPAEKMEPRAPSHRMTAEDTTMGYSEQGPGPSSSDSDERSDTPTSFHDSFQYFTAPDEFGVYRAFLHPPEHDPEADWELEDLADSPSFIGVQKPSSHWPTGLSDNHSSLPFGPFANSTTFNLMDWYYESNGVLSLSRLDSLVHEVVLAPEFQPSDLHGFNSRKEMTALDNFHIEGPFSKSSGWRESSVTIPMSAEGYGLPGGEAAQPQLTVNHIHHRNLTQVVKAAFSSVSASAWTYVPYGLFFRNTPESEPERIISEVYHSDAWIAEHRALQELPVEFDDTGKPIEKAVAAMFAYSDSTRLTNFGPASLWPTYIFFGNQSKYDRAIPSKFGAHHLAYIPELPDDLQKIYSEAFDGLKASEETKRQLKRELEHAIWRLLLDEEFRTAYKEGILVLCADRILRRLFPRIFMYSADYPEKVLVATLKFLSRYPCPRCFIQKKHIFELGNARDDARRRRIRVDDLPRQFTLENARKQIYVHGRPPNGEVIKDMLRYSQVPVRNAFTTLQEADPNFNFYQILLPDLLHEFEIGVWLATLRHILQILYSLVGDLLFHVDERYRSVSPFGRLTIRRFPKKTTAMRKLAARDLEDMLQCSMPVLEGLLPPGENSQLLDLLWILCVWHALAKLRLHTETTKQHLQSSTRKLGATLRKFRREVSKKYGVLPELPAQAEARFRREAKAIREGKMPKRRARKAKKGKVKDLNKIFNLCTSKLHALGDYAEMIFRIGTSDHSSTQMGEQEHKRVKRYYVRTNKNVMFRRQIAKHEHRQRMIKEIKDRRRAARTLASLSEAQKPDRVTTAVAFEQAEPLPLSSPYTHHDIAMTERYPVNIFRLVDENSGDLAFKDFLPKLQDHLAARIIAERTSQDPADVEVNDLQRDGISFDKNRIFKHKVFRINRTTYDMRRDQDSINIRTRPDIMVWGRDSEYPFWYGRTAGVFHAYVKYQDPQTGREQTIRMEFLWVRWFGREYSPGLETNSRRLPMLTFLSNREPHREPFGFVDPRDVIRGVHIIPAFAYGTTEDLLGPSIARQPLNEEGDKDFKFYYVNIFADRDMFMHHIGGGVGHGSDRQHRAYDLTDKEEDTAEIVEDEENNSSDKVNSEDSDESGEEEESNSEDGSGEETNDEEEGSSEGERGEDSDEAESESESSERDSSGEASGEGDTDKGGETESSDISMRSDKAGGSDEGADNSGLSSDSDEDSDDAQWQVHFGYHEVEASDDEEEDRDEGPEDEEEEWEVSELAGLGYAEM